MSDSDSASLSFATHFNDFGETNRNFLGINLIMEAELDNMNDEMKSNAHVSLFDKEFQNNLFT